MRTAIKEPYACIQILMITHIPEKSCFRADGGGELSYTFQDGRYHFDHTEVPPELRGQGIAGQLARAAFDHARKHGWRVVPACSYIEVFLKRHPEYADLIEQPAP
jgi:predicted GNAT family acetyltransferase